jgi:hypothetical protein
MSRNDKGDTPAPAPLPPPNRRASFSQNPSFSTLFGGPKGSPPRAAPDPSLQRRFSWSYPPPKESTSAIDDSDDIATSPMDDSRRGSEIGRKLSTTATSIKEALGFGEPSSPTAMKSVSLQYHVLLIISRTHFIKGNRALICPRLVRLLLPLTVCLRKLCNHKLIVQEVIYRLLDELPPALNHSCNAGGQVSGNLATKATFMPTECCKVTFLSTEST